MSPKSPSFPKAKPKASAASTHQYVQHREDSDMVKAKLEDDASRKTFLPQSHMLPLWLQPPSFESCGRLWCPLGSAMGPKGVPKGSQN